MTYAASWNARAQLWSEQEWISVSAMTTLVRFLESLPFAINARRQAALEYIGNMERTAPFAVDQQMPEWAGQVAISQGDWPNKLRQIVAALNYKHAAEPTRGAPGRRGDEPRADPGSEEAAVPNDVMLSFTAGVESIRVQLGRGDSVWRRASLETELRLTWA